MSIYNDPPPQKTEQCPACKQIVKVRGGKRVLHHQWPSGKVCPGSEWRKPK